MEDTSQSRMSDHADGPEAAAAGKKRMLERHAWRAARKAQQARRAWCGSSQWIRPGCSTSFCSQEDLQGSCPVRQRVGSRCKDYGGSGLCAHQWQRAGAKTATVVASASTRGWGARARTVVAAASVSTNECRASAKTAAAAIGVSVSRFVSLSLFFSLLFSLSESPCVCVSVSLYLCIFVSLYLLMTYFIEFYSQIWRYSIKINSHTMQCAVISRILSTNLTKCLVVLHLQ